MKNTNPNTERVGLRSRLDEYATSAAVNRSVLWKDKLGNWPVYAAAAGSAMAVTTAAFADIIYSGPQNLTATLSHYGYYGSRKINIDGHGNSFVIGVSHTNLDFGFDIGEVRLRGGGARQVLGTGSNLRRLVSGGVISNGLTAFESRGLLRQRGIYSSFTRTRGTWPDTANTGFGGVRFTEGGLPHFGWIRLKFTESATGVPNSITAIDWAYNDVAGAPILAGQKSGPSSVPEPSSRALATLACGAAGLLAWRKRRRSLN